jgi:hypothetical protein
MDNNTFWKLIDLSRRESDGDREAQIEVLQTKLAALSPDEIVAFDRAFCEHHNRAYTWDLWGAAFVIGGGCSDDGFADFRGWLISRGEKDFEAAIVDPETLAKVVKEDDGDCQVEGFQYAAREAWADKTGRSADEFPKHDIQWRKEPAGTQFDENDDDYLATKYPKLAKKFG